MISKDTRVETLSELAGVEFIGEDVCALLLEVGWSRHVVLSELNNGVSSDAATA